MALVDQSCNPRYVAADLLSQAEHDPMASAILVTDDEKVAEEVIRWEDYFTEKLARRKIIRKSLEDYGYVLLAEDMDQAIACVNAIAPEHLEIVTRDPWESLTRIQNAGAIFLGSYSSEPIGDYLAGPNHVLPTNGTARFFSALSVDDFIKKSSVISYSKEALRGVYQDVARFAEAEGLTGHANSVRVRFEEDEENVELT